MTIPIYSSDFETTTSPNDCRVWAYGSCEVGNPDNFYWGLTVDDFLNHCRKLKKSKHYFHNLKFDGEFIINRLFELGFEYVEDRSELDDNTFTTIISDMGQWYMISIMFKYDRRKAIKCEIYDSMKLLNFSVEQIAKSFGFEISKLEIDYNKYRPVGYQPDAQEKQYLHHDVKIVAMALEIVFANGDTKMTVGANALEDLKTTIGKKEFDRLFPSLPLAMDRDIRQAYKGGYVYVNPKYKGKIIGSGLVFDVNSLYPFVMRNRAMPYGEPLFFSGKYKYDKLYPLYAQCFTCSFEIKKDHIPTIQIKNSLSFVPTEYLTTTNNEEITLTLTSVDFNLFMEHYHVYNLEFHSGYKFKSIEGVFAPYVDKWTEAKIEAKKAGNKALMLLAKLKLNSPYGKLATNPIVKSKIPYYENGLVKYAISLPEERKALYIPAGAFITSYAKEITIRSAQKVYNRFMYADTDSLHLEGLEMPSNLTIDSYTLGAWKHELIFTKAKYLRAKSYVEFGYEPGEDESTAQLMVTCAGLPARCYSQVTFENFDYDTVYTGKLTPKRVPGGVVLEETTFKLKRDCLAQ